MTVMFANAHFNRIYLQLYCDCIIAKADVAILLIVPRVLTASFLCVETEGAEERVLGLSMEHLSLTCFSEWKG